MARPYLRHAVLLALFSQVLTFSRNELTTSYIDYVNERPNSAPISCRCPSETSATCNCVSRGINYQVEAPFAAMLVAPPIPSPNWPSPYHISDNIIPLSGREPLLEHLKMMPRPFPEIRTKFKLYYKYHSQFNGPDTILYSNLTNWNTKIPFKLDRLFVIVHGWTGSDIGPEVTSLRDTLLKYSNTINSALILVDWWKAATGQYVQSAADSIVIGNEVGLLLVNLVKTGKLTAKDIHLLGLDMGSHITSIAASTFSSLAFKHNLWSGLAKIGTRIGRRTGFNPLARHFYRVLEPDPLNDAIFVDNIHTSTAMSNAIGGSDLDILNGRYGVSTLDKVDNRNQIDFYPNGGSVHDCQDLYGCSLNKAMELFKQTLLPNYNRTAFTTYPCETYGDLNRCIETSTSFQGVMGIDAPSSHSFGNHFLTTQSQGNIPIDYESTATGEKCRRVPQPKAFQTKDPEHQQSSNHPGCGFFSRPAARIYKGIKAGVQQFPWTVCILLPEINYPDEYDANNHHVAERYDLELEDSLPADKKERIFDFEEYEVSCTGSVLNDNWVVTAAHCFGRIRNNVPIYLVFGSDNCNDPKKPYDKYVRRVVVDKRDNDRQTVFIHDDFPYPKPLGGVTDGDMALIRLQVPIPAAPNTDINAICFEEAEDFDYDDCVPIQQAGFGLNGKVRDGRLKWQPVKIVKPEDAKYAALSVNKSPFFILRASKVLEGYPYFYFANFEDHDKTFDKFEDFSGRAVCGADSGSPVMRISRYNNKATLVGTLVGGLGGHKCMESKQWTTRRNVALVTHNLSIGSVAYQRMWLVKLAYATRLRSFLTFIKETMGKQKTYLPSTDKFWQVSEAGFMGQDPVWHANVLPTDESPVYDPAETDLLEKAGMV